MTPETSRLIAETLRLDGEATKGPWTLEPIPCGNGCCAAFHRVLAQYEQDSEPRRSVATVDGGNAVWLNAGEDQANARTIAAYRTFAPRLARMLREAIDTMTAIQYASGDDGTIEQALAEIEKIAEEEA